MPGTRGGTVDSGRARNMPRAGVRRPAASASTPVKRSLFFAAIANASDMLVFVLMVLAARWLGAEDFGTFSYAQALAVVGLTLMGFGLDPLIIRELSKDASQGSRYLFAMLCWKLPVGCICVLLLYLAGRHLLGMSPDHVLVLTLMGVSTFLRQLAAGFRSMLRPLQRQDLEALGAMLEKTALLSLGAAALALGYGLIGLAVAFCIARGLGVAVGLALVTRFFPLAWVPDLALAARLQRMAIPIGLSFLLTNTYAHVDTFLLKAFADYAQIGLYNVPLKVFMALTMLPAVVSDVLLPRLSATLHGPKSGHNRLILLGIIISFLAVLPVAVGGVLFAETFIVLVFGEAYAASTGVMQILSASLLISSQLWFMQTLLIAVDRQSVLLRTSLAALALRLVLGLLLIPVWGIEGAAAGVAISQLVVCIGGWGYLLKKHFRARSPADLVRRMREAMMRQPSA
jgi:O-antigen/teichoic acid export membrane protein